MQFIWMRITHDILIRIYTRMRTYKNRWHRYEWDILYLECTWCWEWKSSDHFGKQIWWKFWLKSKCSDCIREYRRQNKEHSSEYSKKYRELNKAIIAERNKKRYQRDKDRILEVCKNYRDTHREQRNKHSREYRLENKEKYRESGKLYYQNNRERILEYHKAYEETRNKELWFNLKTFHTRASKYAKSHNLTPSQCPICWSTDKVEIHHPSYNTYNDWSNVVFCCSMCHKQIHSGALECPTPINLLD